jgi:hypothetical protein
MFYEHFEIIDKAKTEHVREMCTPTPHCWINLWEIHTISIEQEGFNYWVKVSFSEKEYYYIRCFDCQKAALRFVDELL